MMTDAKILEVARREISKGIEGARANGVVCGPILRLSISRPELREEFTLLNHCPYCREFFDIDQAKADDCPFCGAQGLRAAAEKQHQERLASRHTAPSDGQL